MGNKTLDQGFYGVEYRIQPFLSETTIKVGQRFSDGWDREITLDPVERYIPRWSRTVGLGQLQKSSFVIQPYLPTGVFLFLNFKLQANSSCRKCFLTYTLAIRKRIFRPKRLLLSTKSFIYRVQVSDN